MNETTTTLAVSGLSFLLTVIWGQPFLHLLRRLKIGKLIRAEGPAVQFTKMGTPTMGGFLFIFPTVLIDLLLNAANGIGVNLIGQSYIIPMMSLVLFAAIGVTLLVFAWKMWKKGREEPEEGRVEIEEETGEKPNDPAPAEEAGEEGARTDQNGPEK